jgi:hypothetical protein
MTGSRQARAKAKKAVRRIVALNIVAVKCSKELLSKKKYYKKEYVEHSKGAAKYTKKNPNRTKQSPTGAVSPYFISSSNGRLGGLAPSTRHLPYAPYQGVQGSLWCVNSTSRPSRASDISKRCSFVVSHARVIGLFGLAKNI